MKVTIDGQEYEYERRMPMSDALAIERAWKRRYAEWESELAAGSAEATGVLVWLLWRRAGRHVPLEDIIGEEPKVDFDYAEVLSSIISSLMRESAEAEAGTANPTTGAPAPDGTGTTSPAMKRSSVKSST